ncbi:MAG: L,D-transpeptidase family protein [Betaproteobacteria bacterium]|nr:L,D-transpeptidase family protein [Betaproteobacteria bacterium]
MTVESSPLRGGATVGALVAGVLARSLLASALGLAVPAAASVHDAAAEGAEARLERVLQAVRGGKLPAALEEVNRLVERYPNWRLAHLVHGDLLLARAAPITGFGNARQAAGDRLEDLRAEALARRRAHRDPPPPDRIPRYLLRFDGGQENAIVVDAERSRVYVYENAGGAPRLVQNFYTSLGKNGVDKLRQGDRRTPLGVYYVTAQIPGRKLPDLYGWGAFPISYPNEWDRMAGKTGYGIWVHGVPSDTYARAPRASDGCIALANADIAELARRVQVGVTPVIIADRIEWTAPEALAEERKAFMERLEAWRTDWESRDADRYLAHYARDFRSDGMDIATWSAHKRRVNAAKRWIKVSLEKVSAFRSPGETALVVVSFDQDYRSSNLAQRTRKRQYWIAEGGRWRIAHESVVSGAAVVLPASYPRQNASLARGRR